MSTPSHTEPVRVGLVGAGRIARLVHLPVLAGLPGAAVVAVVEPDDEARTAAGALAPGATLYADLERMLAEPPDSPGGVEAVVVCAPTGLHADIARAAFAAGRAVYLEKPIAVSLDEGRAVVAAQGAGVGMTGLAFRFSPVFAGARQLAAAGAVGEVVAVQTVLMSPPREVPLWKQRRASGGGALLDLLSHHADLAEWLLGTRVTRVAAHVRSVRTEADTATVRMETEAGVAIQALVSTSGAENHRVEVVGTEGRLVADPWRMPAPEVYGASGGTGRGDRLRVLTPARVLHKPDYHAPFRGALGAFVAGVRSGVSPTPTLADGLRSLAVVEAAERAAQSGGAEAVETLT